MNYFMYYIYIIYEKYLQTLEIYIHTFVCVCSVYV